MSIRLHPQDVIQDPEGDDDSGSCFSSSDEDEDQNDPKTWDDWVSDSQENRECYSLFEDKKLASVTKAIEYDEQTHKFNLDRVSGGLGESTSSSIPTPFEGPTDAEDVLPQLLTSTNASDLSTTFANRSRLYRCLLSQGHVAHDLSQKPSAADLSSLTETEPFFTDDQYLLPAIEDDPLLREHTPPGVTTYSTPIIDV